MSCQRHRHCAYTGTEPGLCPMCHASEAKCAGRHGGRPVDGWGEHTKRGTRVLVASGDTATLRAGQHYDPRKQREGGTPAPRPSAEALTITSSDVSTAAA